MLSMAPCLVPQTVGDHSHAATFLIDQRHPEAQGVHYLDKGLTDLRMLVLSRTAMEESDLLGKAFLEGSGLAFEPTDKAFTLISGESPVLVDVHHDIENGFYRLGRYDRIDNRGDRTGHLTHKIGVGQDPVPKIGNIPSETSAGRLDQISYLDPGRTSHLASLAVHAIL